MTCWFMGRKMKGQPCPGKPLSRVAGVLVCRYHRRILLELVKREVVPTPLGVPIEDT